MWSEAVLLFNCLIGGTYLAFQTSNIALANIMIFTNDLVKSIRPYNHNSSRKQIDIYKEMNILSDNTYNLENNKNKIKIKSNNSSLFVHNYKESNNKSIEIIFKCNNCTQIISVNDCIYCYNDNFFCSTGCRNISLNNNIKNDLINNNI